MPFTQPKPLEPPPPDVAGAAVLVVDDEQVWRTILETDLRMLGFHVVLASDADEALQLAEASRPEVAIIDLMLPEPVDGHALVAMLEARGQSFPVIFYTAYPVFPSQHSGVTAVVNYLSKSVDRADLYALLPPAIRKHRHHQGRR